MKFVATFPWASAASLILTAGLSGCSSPDKVPVTDLRPWKAISSSCADTSETRAEIRAHNSVYDTLRTGKKIVYADDCPVKKPDEIASRPIRG